jgi:hypothetical protein
LNLGIADALLQERLADQLDVERQRHADELTHVNESAYAEAVEHQRQANNWQTIAGELRQRLQQVEQRRNAPDIPGRQDSPLSVTELSRLAPGDPLSQPLPPGNEHATPGAPPNSRREECLSQEIPRRALQQSLEERCVLSYKDVQRVLPTFAAPNSSFTWDEFRNKFENICGDNEIPRERWAKLMYLKLEGDASRIADRLESTQRSDYVALVSGLNKEYNKARVREEADMTLEIRSQHKGESIEEYGKALRELARKAYPTDAREQSVQVLKRLRRGLCDNQMVSRCIDYLAAHPRCTATEAIDHLAEHDAQTWPTRPGTTPEVMVAFQQSSPALSGSQGAERAEIHDLKSTLTDFMANLASTVGSRDFYSPGGSQAGKSAPPRQIPLWAQNKAQSGKRAGKTPDGKTQSQTKSLAVPESGDDMRGVCEELHKMLTRLQTSLAEAADTTSPTQATAGRDAIGLRGRGGGAPRGQRRGSRGGRAWSGPRADDICHGCGGKGHWARTCQRGRVHLCQYCWFTGLTDADCRACAAFEDRQPGQDETPPASGN